ncbi:hypothetical protein EMMF5_001377 [Cystobasidiomycetes sp. EMM_F5]
MGKNRDDDAGPSKNQLRGGLSYVDNKPKFLQNAIAALSGQQSASSEAPGGTPRRTDDGHTVLDEQDAADELPQVVVLNEKRDLTEQEAQEARKDAPTVTSASTTSAKKGASLRFSSSEGKRKVQTGDDAEASETFEELAKRARTDTSAPALSASGASSAEDALDTSIPKPLTKEEKAAKKAKRKADKKMLSFET